MRKVKAKVGAWAVWRTDEYPFVECYQIGVIDEMGVHTNYESPVEGLLFCVGEKDGQALHDEIKRLRAKDLQSLTTRQRLMADMRKRSVVGQLDPRS